MGGRARDCTEQTLSRCAKTSLSTCMDRPVPYVMRPAGGLNLTNTSMSVTVVSIWRTVATETVGPLRPMGGFKSSEVSDKRI